MGSNAGLGRGGHAMVTRQAATVEVNLSQAVEFRVTLDHNQRMRNNSGSDSDINSAIAASAPGLERSPGELPHCVYATEHGCMRARCIAQPDWSAHPR